MQGEKSAPWTTAPLTSRMFFNNALAEVIGISILYFFDSDTLCESDDLSNCNLWQAEAVSYPHKYTKPQIK